MTILAGFAERHGGAAVARYIAGQEQHHQQFDFQDEFRRLLGRNGVIYDERLVWD